MAKVVFLICILASTVACILSQAKTSRGNSQAAQATQSEDAAADANLPAKPYYDSCCCYSTCPSGWTRFQSRCYKFNGTVDTQPNAEAACNEVVFYDQVTGYKLAGEAHLASINSQDEQDFVFDLWQHSLIWPHALVPGSINVNTQNSQWIGAVKNSQNQWTWSDGSYLGFTAWAARQPDGDGTCAHMWTHIAAAGSWNDYRCDNENTKIPHTCEIGLIRHCD